MYKLKNGNCIYVFDLVATIYEALSVGVELKKKWKESKDQQENLSKLQKEMKQWCQECKVAIENDGPLSPYSGLKPWIETVVADL